MANPYREAIQEPTDRVILALDRMIWPQAEAMVTEVSDYLGVAKANSIAQRYGWEHAVETFATLGSATMADAKFHDTPGTVQDEVKEVTACGPSLITVHISGGMDMLAAAVRGRDEAIAEMADPSLRSVSGKIGGILGITVLTSLEEEAETIYGDTAANKVIQFAYMAAETGITGIVCSGAELNEIRARDDLSDLITVVPGINLAGSPVNPGQKRVVTPAEAIESGADYVVLGSTVTKAQKNLGIPPVEAAARAVSEIAAVLS